QCEPLPVALILIDAGTGRGAGVIGRKDSNPHCLIDAKRQRTSQPNNRPITIKAYQSIIKIFSWFRLH
ncbi:hypothetical protein, partial [Methylomonas koyamae]|uniref:hypothetical protein n=1 Tax=Methylomonas koyamae TaxID=702114 RepID=UPI001E46E01C